MLMQPSPIPSACLGGKNHDRTVVSDATVSLVSFYIDGAWERPTDRSGGAIVNPATGGAIAEVPYADASDIDRAVRAAHRAF
jgi:succinate-semialdehyde dehydrogenase/glutarate-semialdehyde dehydrogenase